MTPLQSISNCATVCQSMRHKYNWKKERLNSEKTLGSSLRQHQRLGFIKEMIMTERQVHRPMKALVFIYKHASD